MTPCTDIIGFLNDLLDPAAYDDYGPNGLQVPGKPDIQTVVTGVSANVELFTRAQAEHADLVLVHHGLFWAGPPRALDHASKRRLQLLFEADLALAAYHLPLDGHLELGNNALLAAALGAQDVRPFAAHKATTIGVRARFDGAAVSPDELVARVAAATDRQPLAFTDGPDPVANVGIVSGAAPTTSTTPSPKGSTPSSRVSRPSARCPVRGRRASTSWPLGTTRPRRSACARWASGWPRASACATSSSTCPIRSERRTWFRGLGMAVVRPLRASVWTEKVVLVRIERYT
jgi:putative NIF3 family GTP cyclohydrolase 1 type 2